jgi:hypothetical protein
MGFIERRLRTDNTRHGMALGCKIKARIPAWHRIWGFDCDECMGGSYETMLSIKANVYGIETAPARLRN